MMRIVMQCLKLVLLLGIVGCARAGELSHSDVYRGQVRDLDSGKPLAGVLVVFYWQRDVYSVTTKRITSEFHWATEVLTDVNGYYTVSRAPEKSREQFIRHIASPAVIIFTPGYIQYRIEKDAIPRIYMKRVANPKDALNLGLQPGFPNHHTPLLLKALNDERARLGLPRIQPPEDEEREE